MSFPHLSAFIRGSLLLALAAMPAAAQREPVLKQIKLPHNYYYREMYLPQVTSGPGSVTWSPDGTELIFAMQGSLWRGKAAPRTGGTTDVEQLTVGAYDYQPDWSPDGRYVAFSYGVYKKGLGLPPTLVGVRAPGWNISVADATATNRWVAITTDGNSNKEPDWVPLP